jgi:micrococcal nuclease
MDLNDNYVRRARVLKVIDGDTVALDIDLGFYTHEHMSCRLSGINARELRDPGGKEARDHLAEMIKVGDEVVVSSIKPDKYAGRFDGLIYVDDGPSVNQRMIDDGYAAPYDGKGSPRPVPPWPIG